MEVPADSLDVVKHIIDRVPYSYWAEKEPWKIILMCWTVFNLHALEPAVFLLCIKFPAVAHWFKELAEDSDKKPNLKDGLICVLILLILWAGRGFVIAGVWQVVFHEDQLGLMATLAGFIVSLLGSAIFAANQNSTNLPHNGEKTS